MQWQDNTTAFIRPRGQVVSSVPASDYAAPVCSYIRAGGKVELFHDYCHKMTSKRPLCEITPKSVVAGRQQLKTVQLSHPGMWQQSVAVVTCFSGHVVHNFLACDLSSDCLLTRRSWGRYSCSSDLEPPPPSFSCQSKLQVVPYTLVCDHRHDCSDNSDEDFCVFPMCDPYTTSDCGNSQASTSKRAHIEIKGSDIK